MRNQYKILAEKYEQQIEARKPGTPKVTPYAHKDGTTAYKSLTKWGKRQDWSTSAAAHKAAGIPEPKQEVKEDTDLYGNRNAPPLEVPPEQKESIGRLLDMGYDFHKWIGAGYEHNPETKTAIMIKVKRHTQSIVEVTPDGLCNGKTLSGTKQKMEEEMEPVDDKPDAEDRVADGMTAKLNMTDKSHDSVSHVLRAYWKELEAEWKQHNPTKRMPDDVKEELWHSIYKGMKQAGVDSTEY